MNKLIAGVLLGASVLANGSAFAARDSVDMTTYQHQIDQLRAERAIQAATTPQTVYGYEPGYNTYYGYESTYPVSCNGLPGSRMVVDQWGHTLGVQCPNGSIQWLRH